MKIFLLFLLNDELTLINHSFGLWETKPRVIIAQPVKKKKWRNHFYRNPTDCMKQKILKNNIIESKEIQELLVIQE